MSGSISNGWTREWQEKKDSEKGNCKLCKHCGQPMKPKGVKKRPYEYDHAQGCPYERKRKAISE